MLRSSVCCDNKRSIFSIRSVATSPHTTDIGGSCYTFPTPLVFFPLMRRSVNHYVVSSVHLCHKNALQFRAEANGGSEGRGRSRI